MDQDDIHGRLVIRVLGPFSIMQGGVAQPTTSKKAIAVLAYLARRPDIRVPRETIAGLLWADESDQQARASLRQALSALRRSLNGHADILETDGQSVRLVCDGCTLDVAEFEAAAEADPIAATRRYGGMFLEGNGPVSPEFDRWVEAERRHLESLYAACLLKAADDAETKGLYDQMSAFAAKLLTIDPLQEHVHRRLMRAHFRLLHYDAALGGVCI